jgi:transcriptional regulator with XRE-family HTH domain
MKYISHNLRRLRQDLGITQEELEARSGVPQANISLYETGRMNPNLANLKKLAAALEVSTDQLLEGVRDATGPRY